MLAPGRRPEPYQRVAAYAVVTSARGLLLTQLSDRTERGGPVGPARRGHRPGRGPAGRRPPRVLGGERPARARSPAWRWCRPRTGSAGRPAAGVEDFHAVRIVYRATCPEPTDPVVHDVGGTTADARWVDPAEPGALPLTPGWRGCSSPCRCCRTTRPPDVDGAAPGRGPGAVGAPGCVSALPPGQAEDPQEEDQHPDADDRAGAEHRSSPPGGRWPPWRWPALPARGRARPAPSRRHSARGPG